MQRYTCTADFKIISIAVFRDKALLLHGETCPMTGLRARATSAVSVQYGKRSGGVSDSQSLARPELQSVLACEAVVRRRFRYAHLDSITTPCSPLHLIVFQTRQDASGLM